MQQIPSSKKDNKVCSQQLSQWHNCLGYHSLSTLKQLFPQLSSSSNISLHCEPCEYAKHYKTSYLISMNKSVSIFYIVHTDVWGPVSTVSVFGFNYFVTFVDDFSHVTWVYLLKSKTDMFSTFISFHKMVET